jgi:ribosome-binding protein aMBF1 (putative translation factor)
MIYRFKKSPVVTGQGFSQGAATERLLKVNLRGLMMSTHLCNVGKCIRIAQEIKKVSTKDLCAEMGVARQQMHRWRHSENLKIHTVQSMADIFNMRLEEFVRLDRT